MKARIFVATLFAASLASVSAFASPHSSGSVNIASITQFGNGNTAAVIQAQTVIGVSIGSVNVGSSGHGHGHGHGNNGG